MIEGNKITVLCKGNDDGPDDIWAIDHNKNANGQFTMWIGQNGKFHEAYAAHPEPQTRIIGKLAQGFVELPSKTIDKEKGEVVDITNPPPSKIPSALWYRVTNACEFERIDEQLDIIENTLKEDWPNELHFFQSLNVVKDLRKGVFVGSHELSGGPLGLLLLFSLRRHFNETFKSQELEDLIEIADDDNNLLPNRFDDLGNYLMESCEAFFVLMGWLNDGDALIKGDDVIYKAGLFNGYEHYTSLDDIKKLAIAMGCINAPLNLSAIRPDIPTAFF